MDVLWASFGDDTVRYFESSGGASPTFTSRTVTNVADGANAVFAAGESGHDAGSGPRLK